MAEIHIQRKKRPIWPWIVAFLAALLLLWFLIDYFRGDDKERVENEVVVTDTMGVANNDPHRKDRDALEKEHLPGPVNGYLNFTYDLDNNADMSKDHHFTEHGIRQLVEAIRSILHQKTDLNEELNPKLESMMKNAESITTEQNSLMHADAVRKAFVTASDVLDRIHQKHYPDMKDKINEVRNAATAVDPQQPLLSQANQVKNFFSVSAETLRRMGKDMQP